MTIEQTGPTTFTDDTPTPVEFGRAIEWGWIQIGSDRSIGIEVKLKRDDVIAVLKADAINELPPGTRFELRQRHATNYGRTHGMAWYHASTFADRKTWDDIPGHDAELGVYIVARLTTPRLDLLPVAGIVSEVK